MLYSYGIVLFDKKMDFFVLLGIWIPFIGTSLGAAFVFFMRGKLKGRVSAALMGFTSGVMMAAAVWSLLLPSIEMSSFLGKFAFAPAAGGFLAGILFLLALNRMVPHLWAKTDEGEKRDGYLQKIAMMVFAITLHNIPEGMAVGVVFSNCLAASSTVSEPLWTVQTLPVEMAGAFLLSLGIAIQNIPEGAIISMPLLSSGKSRRRAFAYGVLSGLVEPAGAMITILLTKQVEHLLAYLLAFAAGAMVYVIVEELVPESCSGKDSAPGTVGFAIGFVIMMVLDVVFG